MWNFNQYKENIALIDENGRQLDYTGLQKENDKLATAVGGRCLVFSMCSNTIGSVVGYTSFIRNNIVPVLLNAHLDEELLNNLLKSYYPSYIWMPSDMIEKFSTFQSVYES
jgi:hypothetical protein